MLYVSIMQWQIVTCLGGPAEAQLLLLYFNFE